MTIRVGNRFSRIIVYIQLFLLVILLVDLISIPIGIAGVIASLSILLITMLTCTPETVGIFLILFGPHALGMAAQSFEIKSFGSITSILVGTLILIIYGKGLRALIKEREGFNNIRFSLVGPIFWLIFFELMLIISYFYGPQNAYSEQKIIYITFGMLIGFYSLFYIYLSNNIDCRELALLCLISSVVYYQSAIVVAPLSRPENIFQTNGVYDNALVLGQLSIVPTVDIALLASIGFILYYSFLAECQKLQINGIIFCILAFISLIIINSCGQRVFIFGIPIVMSIMLLYPHRNYRFLVMSMLSMSIALAIIVYQSILSNNYRYELIMSLDTGIFERFDRVINWSAAIDRIREYPYFGHGLGGYYIEGLSSPGEEYWAHNIFLEIASEMGLIFLIALIIPVIILLLKFGKKLFHIRAADGTLLSPIFLIIFIQSIFSQDLRETVILLPFTAIFWINSVTLRNGNC